VFDIIESRNLLLRIVLLVEDRGYCTRGRTSKSSRHVRWQAKWNSRSRLSRSVYGSGTRHRLTLTRCLRGREFDSVTATLRRTLNETDCCFMF